VFIVPVVIDGTPEYGAVVPESFNRAQWTRLAGGLPSTAFIEQVKRLLETPVHPAPRPAAAPAPTALARKGGLPGWTWGALAAVVVGVIAAVVVAQRSARGPVAPEPSAAVAAPGLPAPATDKSIAVLPFTNLSADKENEFFADGMHDDLITALAKVRALRVISRTSVLPYKGGERNLRKIAADLGVAHVLEGSVQRAGNRVRLNVQLIDARTDAHLWAETYNRDLTDIFALQAALTQEIAGALKATLTPGERTLLARRPTGNQQAYDLYLRARILDQALQVASSLMEYERVASLYEEAAALDPAFTLAHVQASISHGSMYWFAALDPSADRRRRSLEALERARALAPGSPEVRMAEGSFEYTCNNNWPAALREYRAAEDDLPNDSQLQYRIALAHRRLGEMSEAVARLERCVALNPNDTRSITTLIETLLQLRRYSAVLARFDQHRGLVTGDYQAERFELVARLELGGDPALLAPRMAALPPRAADPHGLDAAYVSALFSGDLARAERILQDPRWGTVPGLGGTVNEPVTLHRAQTAWLLGRPDEARRLADEAIRYFQAGSWSVRQQPVVQMGIARAEALAGRAETALRAARAAVAAQERLDQLSLSYVRYWLGGVLILTGRPDEALGELRRLMALPCPITPNEFRHDPLWSRLRDDPRFEEILKSAKPL
jgi:TolB-like protein